MSKLIKNCFYLLGCLLLVNPAVAMVQSLTQTWPLSHFMLEDKQIVLESVDGAYSFSFPISERQNPLSAELNIALTNSNLLHERRAQFVVYVNDFVIGQIKLNPVNNAVQTKFTIAKEYLRQGYNHVTLKVAQHYTETQCEDWSAPELWTNINAEKSTLTFNYENIAITEKLSAIDALINEKLGKYALSILRPSEAITDDYLYWGAMATQGVQLRLKYAPMQLKEQLVTPYQGTGRFNLDPAQLKNDVILLGTKAQLQPLVSADIDAAITGAYLGIFQQDQDKEHFVLVISGNNNEEVKKAVQSFALLNAQFPDTQQTVIHKALFSKAVMLNPPKAIIPNSTYSLSQFGFKYTPLNAANSEVSLNIRMPPDLYGTEENIVELNLNFAYGAGMRKDSVINVYLNGLFNQAILLKETEGAYFRNYHITMPLREFSAGLNKITFSTVLTPSEYGQCAYVQRDNLLVSIYEDSTITFPDVGRGTSLPDLQLLSKTSFPFIINGFADGTVFKVLDNSSESIAATWHLIAKLANNFETPVYDINITQGDIATNKHAVLIGHVSAANASVLAGSPVKLGALSQYPYRFKEEQIQPAESFFNWVDRSVLEENPLPMTTTVKPNSILVEQTGGLGERFLMVSYPSPTAKDHLVLALVSEENHSLYTGMNTLFTSSLWSQLEGNIFSWDKQEKFYSQQEGDTFLTEPGISRHKMEQFFSKHPWQWLLLIVSTLLIIAWFIHLFLSRRKKLYNPDVD